MRIAVIQLPVAPTRRTLTLHRALQVIDDAARADPAPDLILLPAFCDVPAVTAGHVDVIERLAGQTVAACSWRARHWGVFIALGLVEQGRKGLHVTGALLDADGDLRLAQRQRCFTTTPGGRFTPGDAFSTADVLLGRAAILAGDDVLDAASWDAAAAAGADFVLGIACWTCDGGGQTPDARDVRGQIAGHAKRSGLCGGVADVTTGDAEWDLTCPGFSTIVNAEGRITAEAETGKAATLRGEWSLPASSSPD